MRVQDLALNLESGVKEPLVRQIVRALATAIRAGRLKPGAALPGVRVLAQTLGVNRHTVLAALRELELEGWVESRERSGTFVAERLPDQAPRRWNLPEQGAWKAAAAPGFDLPSRATAPLTSPVAGHLDLREGRADARLAPQDALARAYQRALRLHGNELLQSGEPRGNATFRQVLAELLSERLGTAVAPGQVMTTRGSHMGLGLVVSALMPQGGAVAVEDPGNPGAWEALRQRPGVTLHPIPVDAGGLRVDALEARLQAGDIRLLYLTPAYQFPTGATLAPERRARVLELAHAHRVAVLEDGLDGEFYHGDRPLLPLVAGDATGQVIHMGSFSTLLAPGLRLGFLVAPEPFVDRLAKVRTRMEVQGDRVLEWAMADLIRDGELSRHVRRARRVYQERRERAVELVRASGILEPLGAPAGGFSLWAQARPGLDLDRWAPACRAEGVLTHPGRHFSLGGEPLPFTRLGFAHLEEEELAEAVRRMARAAHRMS